MCKCEAGYGCGKYVVILRRWTNEHFDLTIEMKSQWVTTVVTVCPEGAHECRHQILCQSISRHFTLNHKCQCGDTREKPM